MRTRPAPRWHISRDPFARRVLASLDPIRLAEDFAPVWSEGRDGKRRVAILDTARSGRVTRADGSTVDDGKGGAWSVMPSQIPALSDAYRKELRAWRSRDALPKAPPLRPVSCCETSETGPVVARSWSGDVPCDVTVRTRLFVYVTADGGRGELRLRVEPDGTLDPKARAYLERIGAVMVDALPEHETPPPVAAPAPVAKPRRKRTPKAAPVAVPTEAPPAPQDAPAAPPAPPAAPDTDRAPAATPDAPAAVSDRLYETPVRKIGRHEWRLWVYERDGQRFTEWEWRAAGGDWRNRREWPSYDGNRSDDGLPAGLARVYDAHRQAIRDALRIPTATPAAPPVAPVRRSRPVARRGASIEPVEPIASVEPEPVLLTRIKPMPPPVAYLTDLAPGIEAARAYLAALLAA